MSMFRFTNQSIKIFKLNFHRYKHIAVLWLCANWLAMSNSCHNPFIYGLCSVS